MRAVAGSLLILSLSGNASSGSGSRGLQPDVIDAGRVLATLDDWRAITFILMFMVMALMGERLWAAWLMRREREKMWDVAQHMGANAEKIAEAMHALRTEIVVLRVVSSRMETHVPEDSSARP